MANLSFQHLDLSTSRPFNLSTFQLFDLSTFRPFDLSSVRPFNRSTFRPFNLSTFRPFAPGTRWGGRRSWDRVGSLAPERLANCPCFRRICGSFRFLSLQLLLSVLPRLLHCPILPRGSLRFLSLQLLLSVLPRLLHCPILFSFRPLVPTPLITAMACPGVR